METKNTLILMTSGFPFGHAEPFLEDEVPFLAKGFDAVIIVAVAEKAGNQRAVPENCEVQHLPLAEMNISVGDYLNSFLKKEFWSEIGQMCFSYKLFPNKGRVATAIKSLIYGAKIADFLMSNISPERLQKSIAYSYWLDDSAVALAMLRHEGKVSKAVSRMHGWDVYFDRSAIQYLPFRPLLENHLDQFYPISETAVKYSFGKWAKRQNKFTVAKLGVHLSEQTHDEANRRLLVSASSVIPLKRVHLIVEGLKDIQEPVQWVHFGEGPLLNELKSSLDHKALSQHKIEFKGHVSKEELMDYYSIHRPGVFINVSSTEGIPVSIIEAMSYGIPVIATNVGGTGELVNDSTGVLLNENCSPKAIAKAVNDMMAAPDMDYLRASMSARGTVVEQHSAERNFKSLVHHLKAL